MENILNAAEIFDYLGKTNILMAFCGRFDHTMNTSLLLNSKLELDQVGEAFGVNKKVYNVLVESVENVTRYAAHGNKNDIKSMLLLCKTENSYKIITCNAILNKDVIPLKNRLDTVIKLRKEELKANYREQILAERISENAAGLGIIDIALKTDNKIQYHFKDYSENTSLYFFQAEINI